MLFRSTIIADSLSEPARIIASNAGKEGAVIVERLKNEKGAIGYNAATGVFEDMIKAGIVDPTKVARSALQNAASIAALLLTTEVTITDIPEDDRGPGMPPGGGMPGMM